MPEQQKDVDPPKQLPSLHLIFCIACIFSPLPQLNGQSISPLRNHLKGANTIRMCRIESKSRRGAIAITTAKRVAGYIVAFSHEHGDTVSNLKLQKLVYYAQAWYLALYGEVLFNKRIEAWVHGPVVAPLCDSYKG